MTEFIFKLKTDALKLQHCLTKYEMPSWFHETLFQHKTHYNLIIDHSSSQSGKERLLQGTTEFILNEKCMDWAEEILKEHYYYEDEHEIEHILEIVSDMKMGDRPELEELMEQWDAPSFVKESLDLLLDGNSPISFDSFSTFRLKRLRLRIGKMVGLAIDEYKMEQEYQMFVHMLREYLAAREKKLETIHLYSTGFEFRFFDENMREVSRSELTQYIDKRLLTNHPLYVDSYTIAPLLSLAPEKIFVYGNGDHNLVRTLQNIFEERIDLLPRDYFPETLLYPSRDIANE
ncbi:putative sporulation protein YtxC [Rossellomorea aquimaris]|uniref:putative sporulation protein YtxC n=1 Tax=Rossellomorea aquimaris TaxID=189382 RepID=UPI001CD57241|nr:putative sporulation protein YtxC [Rossellomorea aquimaris]MCA1056402.1 putative sporulation protein YtxC [Rossellomorea aquimaris]